MKNYEKAYKEALEKIREGLHPLPDGTKISGVTRAFLEEVFPELKESEDERIRKVLIDYFNRYKEQEECGVKTFYGIPTDNILTWLEKQGKKNPTWSEGDETLLYEIVDYFNMDDALRHTENEIIDWLKSLKERLS